MYDLSLQTQIKYFGLHRIVKKIEDSDQQLNLEQEFFDWKNGGATAARNRFVDPTKWVENYENQWE